MEKLPNWKAFRAAALTDTEAVAKRAEVNSLHAMQNRLTWQPPREGYECKKCKNHECITYIGDDDFPHTAYCECKTIRDNLARARKAGMLDLVQRYTFDRYETNTQWRVDVKQRVEQYTKDDRRGWLYIGGQTGSGKTHLCTAAVNEFIRQGLHVAYLSWIEEGARLKAIRFSDNGLYEKEMMKYKTAPVLFIDDLFKTQQGQSPTAADIQLAIAILNYRYNNPNMTAATLISSEYTLDDLHRIDSAIEGRIYEKAKGYVFEFTKQEMDYRFHNSSGLF